MIRRSIIAAALLLTLNIRADIARNLDLITRAWEQGRYTKVLQELRPYHDRLRTVAVEYMLATSACRLAAHRQDGVKHYEHLRRYSDLTSDDKRQIDDELAACQAAIATRPPQPLVRGRATIKTKRFYNLGTTAATGSDTVEKATYDRRTTPSARFHLDEINVARAWVDRYFQPHTTHATRHFLIASKHHTAAALRPIAANLEHAYEFLATEYFSPPEYLVIVLLVPDIQGIRDTAELHAFELPPTTIGYTSSDDWTIVAVAPGELIGSVKHELVHLMFAQTFGDAPPWLHEGIAALYESSERSNARLMGITNWRMNVLHERWSAMPSLAALLRMTWSEFQPERPDLGDTDVNEALARYLTLYLQEHGWLSRVVRELHENWHDERSDAWLFFTSMNTDQVTFETGFRAWLWEQQHTRMTPAHIRRIQAQLVALNFLVKRDIDGRFGPRTRQALDRFRRQYAPEQQSPTHPLVLGRLEALSGKM